VAHTYAAFAASEASRFASKGDAMTQERYEEESAEERKGAPPADQMPENAAASGQDEDDGEEQMHPPVEQFADTHAEPRQPRPA
jgi:hypothetical protein